MKKFYKALTRLLYALLFFFFYFNNYGQVVVSFDPVSVTTVAGNEVPGFTDGTGLSAKFNGLTKIAFDKVSGCFYATDAGNNRVRRITTDGVVSTYAGSGISGHLDGSAATARFASPRDITVDRKGNVYISDDDKYIRKISTSGIVTTLAGNSETGYVDSTGANARFNELEGITVDTSGNIYAVDRGNDVVRKITPNGVVTTFAKPGLVSAGDMHDITIDTDGNLYILHYYDVAQKITPDGTISSIFFSSLELTEDGYEDRYGFEEAIIIDSLHNFYFGMLGDDSYNFIRKATPLRVASRMAGYGYERIADGVGDAAHFYGFSSLGLDNAGVLYIVTSNRLKKITAPQFNVFTASTGEASAVQLFRISGVNLTGNAIVTAPDGYEISLLRDSSFSPSLIFPPISGERPSVRVYIRLSATATAGLHKGNITLSSAGAQTKLLPVGGNVYAPLVKFDATDVTTLAGSTKGFVDGNSKTALFNSPRGISIDASGNLYVADQSNNAIRKIAASGVVTTLAGTGTAGFVNGPAASAQFNQPAGITTDISGNIYIADYGNNVVRKISATGIVTTFAGSAKGFIDGFGNFSKFSNPQGVCADTAGNIYVADASNNRVRKITPGSSVSTFAGSGVADLVNDTGAYAAFRRPVATAVDLYGNVYVADIDNNCIRKITPTWAATVLAGGSKGSMDGIGTAAQFNQPNGVAVDRYGNVYVADAGNNRIRKISPAGVVTTVAGSIAGFADSTGLLARFNQPKGITVDASGNIYVSDAVNNRIRKINIPVTKPFSSVQGTPSAVQSVSVSGLFLRANATVSSPPGFEISLAANSGYKSVLTIVPAAREITSTTVYIRVKASALAGTYNGNVTLSTTGSATQKLPVTATVMPPVLNKLIVQNKLDIFPNPTKGLFTVQLKDADDTDLQLKIYDANGRIVMDKKVSIIRKTQTITIQLTNAASGVYFIQITGSNTLFESRVIVEK